MNLQTLSQRDPRWKDIPLGTSKTTTIGSHGCTITCLAMLAGTTPNVVNQRMNAVGGYANTNLVIWTKVPEALPNLEFVWRGYTYDNERVKANLPCLVEVDFDGTPRTDDRHWVVYKGAQKMNDPWTGTERPTNAYPIQTGFTIYRIKDDVSQPNPGEVNPPMADNTQITIAKELFEELVGKASKYDGFFNAGYSDIKVVTRRLNEADRDLAAEREKVASLEQQLKDAQKPVNVTPSVPSTGSTPHIPEGGSQEEYDYWKKVAWRFLRTGVASGISTAALVTVAPVTDLSSVQTAAVALGMAFFSGFISAAGMMVRDSLSGGDMTARSQKLPV